MLKTKQRDLKAIIASNKESVAMKCAECLAFFVDGYEKCTSKTCSLLRLFPTASYISKGTFIEKMKAKARELGNDEKAFVSRIEARQDSARQRSKKADWAKDDQIGV